MSYPITLLVNISSGWEHSHVPAKQAERLAVVLDSLRHNTEGELHRILVIDQPSPNWSGQRNCRAVARSYDAEYHIKPEPFTGPTASGNFGMFLVDTEMVACIQDDVYFTKGAFDYMQYVVDSNDHVPWGMLGWSIIFANALIRAGHLFDKSDFYTQPHKLESFRLTEDYKTHIVEGGFTWGHPYFQKHSSGPAYILRKSIWEQVGGYHEALLAGDEDYGENCWWVAKKYCIQLPTPPVLHYEGACGWPDWLPPSSLSFQHGWRTRPHCPCEMKNRGTKSFERMAKVDWDSELLRLDFPLPGDCRDEQITLDRDLMASRTGALQDEKDKVIANLPVVASL